MASSARTSLDKNHAGLETPAQTSSPHSLSRAVHARRAEYVRPQKIKIKIGSWNVAACPGTERDLKGWFAEGKGVDIRLAGLQIKGDGVQENVESVEAQEARRTKKESTIPKGDTGLVPGGEEIGLYVLGLQEVVELTSAKEYIGRVYTDPGPTAKWRHALVDALPTGYVQISEQQLSGLLLFIFASPAIAPTISSVSTVSVGTGIMGYLGNKGAVTTRVVIGDTTRMVFVNSHLASGSDLAHLDRRCWDVAQILQRTKFEPINWGGVLDDTQEGIGEEDFAFWFGDLNFRLDGLPGDDIRRLLMLHTKDEYDIGRKSRNKIEGEINDNNEPIVIHSVESDDDSEEEESRTSNIFTTDDDTSSMTLPDPDDFVDPSQDPLSLQATLDSLLPHDQLKQAQKKRKAFHDGWREGHITFLPTYKYDVGSMGVFDSSEKKRAPSWCDRILFRTRRDKLAFDGKTQEEELARIKDEEMKKRGIDQAKDDEDVLFDYNPEEDGENTEEQQPLSAVPSVEEAVTAKDIFDDYDDDEVEEVVTKEGFVDRIHLDIYTSHQRVLSSDHKPLDAVFTLEYDAVVPELKSKIQAEVARELDRAENEGRPGITVVVDHSHDVEPPKSPTGGAEVIVDFSPVSFQKRIRRSLTIANTGQVNSTFAFVEHPSEAGESASIGPPWLSVCFVGSELDEDTRNTKDLKREVTLEPGDAVNCTLEVYIDDISLVKSLNSGIAKLDDVLVLRVTDGRDHFIPIRGSWLQSCFGRSVEELITVPEGGVRALLPRRKGEEGGPVNRGKEVRWSAPRELFKLTEAVEGLTERSIAEAGILENAQIPKELAGWPFDERLWLLKDPISREEKRGFVLEALDSDKSLIECFPPEIPAIQKLEILAEVLVTWLASLTDGIVPESLWTQLDNDISERGSKQLTSAEETKNWVLDTLSASPNHNIAFVFLTSMLNRVAAELCPITRTNGNGKENVEAKEGSEGSFGRKSLDSVRRGLSWKGKAPQMLQVQMADAKEVQRRVVKEKAFAEVMAGVVFRPNFAGKKEKERRVSDERRRYILEAFLNGGGSPR
jgi:phosphatidylinositol-bisphosphatase